jgi:hypothetical protein
MGGDFKNGETFILLVLHKSVCTFYFPSVPRCAQDEREDGRKGGKGETDLTPATLQAGGWYSAGSSFVERGAPLDAFSRGGSRKGLHVVLNEHREHGEFIFHDLHTSRRYR